MLHFIRILLTFPSDLVDAFPEKVDDFPKKEGGHY